MLLAGLVYLNALHNPFVYDDYRTVVANQSIDPPIELRRVFWHDATRPIVNASYAVDRAMWGRQPFGFHLTSVLLHALNVALLFVLVRGLTANGSDVAAIAAASLFAVHPMMTEAVGYISGRAEILCAAFFLAALCTGRRWLTDGGAAWGLSTIVLWIAAIGSKETAGAFPVVLLALDSLTLAGPPAEKRRRLFSIHLPLIATACAIAIARLVVLHREYPDQVAPKWSYVPLALDVLRRYLALLVNPTRQTIFHAVDMVNGFGDPRSLLAMATVAALVILVWRVRRAQPVIAFGLCWTLLVLGPSTMLTVLGQGEPMAEHRVYLASAGFFLAVGGGISVVADYAARRGPAASAAAAGALILVIAAFAAETLVRNATWRDPVALWRESVELAPNHYWPRLALGEALLDAGQRKDAADQFSTAIQLQPAEPRGYVKLAQTLVESGRFDEARTQLARALELDPENEAARRMVTMLQGVTRAK
jgi:protein O-mannosyl-transferase